MKQARNRRGGLADYPAAFGRLCVETADRNCGFRQISCQPPSGGCVLKPSHKKQELQYQQPAAFGRLCVETSITTTEPLFSGPAAFGRLCVETVMRPRASPLRTCQPPSGGCVLKLVDVADPFGQLFQPPSGGCVLKLAQRRDRQRHGPSRLRAAVC